jgi:hypothetical protein
MLSPKTLHNIRDFAGNTDTAEDTAFGSLAKDNDGNDVYLYEVRKTYDWVNNDGYNNFGMWVEESAKAAAAAREEAERVP